VNGNYHERGLHLASGWIKNKNRYCNGVGRYTTALQAEVNPTETYMYKANLDFRLQPRC
jgi:hypothetical protein